METVNEFIELNFKMCNDIKETIGYAEYDSEYIIVTYSLASSDCLFDFNNTWNEVELKIHSDYFKKYHQDFELIVEKQNVCCNTQSKLFELINCNVTGIARSMYLESIVLYLVYQIQKNNLVFQLNCDSCFFVNKPSELDKIKRAKDFIINNLDQNITIPILSNLVGTNQCYLKRGFKEVTGKTIFEFIQENRMEKAKYFLQNTDKTIGEIALITGYASISSFSQSFKNYFGITPGGIAKMQI